MDSMLSDSYDSFVYGLRAGVLLTHEIMAL